jgi:hypothetical protein
MRLNLVIGGIIVAVVIFIVLNIMVTFAPDTLNGLLKPLLCPNGEYSSYSGAIQQGGRERGTRSTECQLPSGERYNVDSQMVGIIFLLTAVPLVVTWGSAWLIGVFRLRKMPEVIGAS